MTDLGAADVVVAGLAAALLAAAAWAFRWRRRVAQRLEDSDTARRPRGADGVVLGAGEIRLVGTTDRAVLLLHGFNDTPQSMAYLGARLAAAGYTVHAPRLPGHGCGLADMARSAHAEAWRQAVREAHAALRREYAVVPVCGQSMGGALAVWLATTAGHVPALALLAPFIGLPAPLRRQFRLAALSPAKYHRSLGGERSLHDPIARRAALGPGIVTARMLRSLEQVAVAAEAALPSLDVPTLYVQSTLDNRISAADGQRHFEAISAPIKEQLWLSGSGHIISADLEREIVADRVIAWFARG